MFNVDPDQHVTKRVSTTAKLPRRSVAALVGVFILLAASAAVYAAKAAPDFKLRLSSATATVVQGRAASYRLRVKREHRFRGPVRVSLRGLPSGAKASWRLPDGRALPRVKRSSAVAVLPARRSAAVLSIQTSGQTAPGRLGLVLRATARRSKRNRKLIRHAKKLSLIVQRPAASPPASAPAQQALELIAAPATRKVLQGDETTFSVELARSGFSGPVAMSVSHLPPGATPAWAPGNPVEGSSATLTIAAAQATPPGSYEITITGTGGGRSSSSAATLVVQPTVAFTIEGDLGSQLRPGSTVPLDLRLTNPYDFPLKVSSLDVAATTSQAGCSATTNFGVKQYGGPTPLVLQPGSSQLSTLVADSSKWPAVEMLELAGDQDACKGAPVQLEYSGSATK